MPIYYLDSETLNDAVTSDSEDRDTIAKTVAARNWADWRPLRFADITSAKVESTVAEMAKSINRAMSELKSIIAASKAKAPTLPPIATDPIDLRTFSVDPPALRRKSLRSAKSARFVATSGVIKASYYAYTRQYDEAISALNLSDQEELNSLNRQLTPEVTRARRSGAAKIRICQHRIMSIGAGGLPSVTLLIDNSGSLRGHKIAVIAAWVSILSSLLEKCGIEFQTLGFTTRAWKGGQSRELWVKDGKPRNPGRLNDLRHVIYKDFSASHKDTVSNLALMLRERLLKENVDGEAILWACRRVVERVKFPSVIIMISDGAPVDDSTLSANPDNYLDEHLRATIKWLNKTADFTIYGVGVEFDASRYYANGISVSQVDNLGIELLDVLPYWLGFEA